MIPEAAVQLAIRTNNLTVTPTQYGKIKKWCAQYNGQWNDHLVFAVCKLVLHFNGQMDQFLAKTGLGVQESGISLPHVPSPIGTKLMFKYAHRLADVLVVLNSKEPWSIDERLDDILVRLRQRTYDGTDVVLETECAKWGLDVDTYETVKSYWSRRHPTRYLPDYHRTNGDWTIRFLDVDDPKGLFLGNYVKCCQSIGDAGESCAIHGATNEYGRFLVMEFRGCMKLISWVWVHIRKNLPTIMVMDSLEHNTETSHREELLANLLGFLDDYVPAQRVLPMVGNDHGLLDGIPTQTVARYFAPTTDDDGLYLSDSTKLKVLL